MAQSIQDTTPHIYKTVFHALVTTLTPKENTIIDDDMIELLVGSTVRTIGEQLPAMIKNYGLHAYKEKMHLCLGEFKELTLMIGMMDIYNRNILMHNANREMIYVHHTPFFMPGRLTMVFEQVDGGVILKEEVQTLLPLNNISSSTTKSNTASASKSNTASASKSNTASTSKSGIISKSSTSKSGSTSKRK